jgi:hypothetical protein
MVTVRGKGWVPAATGCLAGGVSFGGGALLYLIVQAGRAWPDGRAFPGFRDEGRGRDFHSACYRRCALSCLDSRDSDMT